MAILYSRARWGIRANSNLDAQIRCSTPCKQSLKYIADPIDCLAEHTSQGDFAVDGH